AKSLITPLARKAGNRDAVEQAAILGALDPEMFKEPQQAEQIAAAIARRLDALAADTDRGWKGAFRDGNLVFERRLRGEIDRATIDAVTIGSVEGRRRLEVAGAVQGVCGRFA